MCWTCEIVLGSLLRVRQHILSQHFKGPLAKCGYCGVFSKTEASLDRHIRRKHKKERDMGRSQWEVTNDEAKAVQNSVRSGQGSDVCPLPPPPTPCKYKSASSRLGNLPASKSEVKIMDQVSDKLLKIEENLLKKVKKILRFEEAVNTVGPGFQCETCGETFLQRHDCLIHQFSMCLPNKGKHNRKEWNRL